MNEIFLFCLFWAAQQTGIQVHCAVALGNHWHAIVTDPGTNISRFARYLNANLARVLNARYGRWDSFWDARPCSIVKLMDADTVLEKMAYVMANPVSSG